MKERPILFSAEMVRAILEGRKTQTRRVIKPQPNKIFWNNIVVKGYGGWTDEHGKPCPCTYGKVGDRLWVRETFASIDIIPLEITNIRVERIQDISFLDAIWEGIPNNLNILARWKALPFPEQIKLSISTIDTFKDMWDSINAKRGHTWDTNPFVWVIEFKGIK